MKDLMTQDPEHNEIELLLPWYANGRLSVKDKAAVEHALAGDAELRRRLEIVREELGETVRANERLPAASSHALDKLLAGMDAEPRTAPLMASVKSGLVGWLASTLASLSPQKLAYAAVAALAVIAVQGAALTGLVVGRGDGSRFDTASAPATAVGTFVMLSFAPDARAADIASFFKRYDAAVIDGPRANGFFKVRVSGKALAKPELDQLVDRIKAERSLIGFVAPAN